MIEAAPDHSTLTMLRQRIIDQKKEGPLEELSIGVTGDGAEPRGRNLAPFRRLAEPVQAKTSGEETVKAGRQRPFWA